MNPFILHIENGQKIAAENRSVVATDWEYEEVVNIKQQEKVFWGDETFVCQLWCCLLKSVHVTTHITVKPKKSILLLI